MTFARPFWHNLPIDKLSVVEEIVGITAESLPSVAAFFVLLLLIYLESLCLSFWQFDMTKFLKLKMT